MNHWTLHNSVADYSADLFRLTWDPTNPADGLEIRLPDCVTVSPFHLFGIAPVGETAPPPPRDIALCGTTLRATLPESELLPVETDIAWRVLDLEMSALGLDMVLSVRTQKLVAHPQIELASRVWGATLVTPIAAAHRSPAEQPYFLLRLQGADFSYIEMLHPANPQTSGVSLGSAIVLRHRLFACPLEKGVILRARLRALLVNQDGDEVAAAACFAQFLDSPVPLGR